MPNFKKRKNIVHIIQAIIAIIVAALVSDTPVILRDQHTSENQFLDAAVFGYLIITLFVLITILVDEDIPEKLGYTICAIGALMYLGAGIILILEADRLYWKNSTYDRWMAGGAFSIINFLIYFVELIITLVRKDVLEENIK